MRQDKRVLLRVIVKAIGHLTRTNAQDHGTFLRLAPYSDVPDDVTWDNGDWPVHPGSGTKLFRLDFLADGGLTSPRNVEQVCLLVDWTKSSGAEITRWPPRGLAAVLPPPPHANGA